MSDPKLKFLVRELECLIDWIVMAKVGNGPAVELSNMIIKKLITITKQYRSDDNDPKLLYIAGLYRAPTINEIYNNIQEARKRAEWAWQNGWIPLCPHTNTAFMDGLVSDEIILAGCIRLMSVCDAILLMDGWVKSTGARAECQLAIEMKMEIVDDPL